MTIPYLVMIISGAVWLLLETLIVPNTNEPYFPRFHHWLIQVCTIVFAVSVLIVLYGLANRSAF